MPDASGTNDGELADVIVPEESTGSLDPLDALQNLAADHAEPFENLTLLGEDVSSPLHESELTDFLTSLMQQGFVRESKKDALAMARRRNWVNAASAMAILSQFITFCLSRIVGLLLGVAWIVVALLAAPKARFLKRLGALSAIQALTRDNRPPIVYLRSFGRDSVMFSNRMGWSFSREEKLALRMSKQGPFIAIGQPGETAPQLGACRLYVDDEHWKMVVERMVHESQMVLILFNPTDGLRWELDLCMRMAANVPIYILVERSDAAEFNEYLRSTGITSTHKHGVFRVNEANEVTRVAKSAARCQFEGKYGQLEQTIQEDRRSRRFTELRKKPTRKRAALILIGIVGFSVLAVAILFFLHWYNDKHFWKPYTPPDISPYYPYE